MRLFEKRSPCLDGRLSLLKIYPCKLEFPQILSRYPEFIVNLRISFQKYKIVGKLANVFSSKSTSRRKGHQQLDTKGHFSYLIKFGIISLILIFLLKSLTFRLKT
jgi:hypothetical protein